MNDFRFQIGDLVYVRQGVQDALNHCKMGNFSLPYAFCISEKLAQECPGGVQRHYKMTGGDPHAALQVLEHEVVGDFNDQEFFVLYEAALKRQNQENS